MKRSTRAALVAVVAIGTTAAGALPATADGKPDVTVEKDATIDLDIKAGEACSFPTTIHGEADIRTITSKRKTVTAYSHAFARITNATTGRSVRLNANVTFVDKTLSNGDVASTSRGNAVIWGTHVGFSTEAGPAFLYVRGRSSWTTVDPGGDESLVFHRIKGSVTNICDLID